ncbi:MAG: SDR family NAD(P)-dependent oxidoreductase [Novosphingobium sp.]|nr:SDR family NAD(P)-dependent oxidoreductase [Novosphingobium sp.]
MTLDPARHGPWAVIPGGSEGIGACIARRLAKLGISSVLIARKTEPLEEIAEELRGLGVEARTLALDLTAPDMLERVRAVTDDLEVGLLVYNAGASLRTGPFIDWDLADVEQVIRLNVVGQTTLSHHFGQQMAKRGRGGIVLMGSLAGVAGSPSVITYSGAKAYSQIFSEGLWWEMKQHDVDVLHVVVGQTDTPAMARLGITYEEGEGDDPDMVAQLALDNIAKGPVVVVPNMQEGFDQLTNPDRKGLTEQNAAFILSNTEGTWD